MSGRFTVTYQVRSNAAEIEAMVEMFLAGR